MTVQMIQREGRQIAILVLPGVQYYTGQRYDIELLTKVGHDQVSDR